METNRNLNYWQRIEQLIKWTGSASVSAFARNIDLSRGENLYQIKRGNNGISKDLAERISAKYPDISRAWLLTGEGAMLRNDHSYRVCDIPFFKEDAVKVALSTLSTEPMEPVYYLSFPMFDGCDFAAFTNSAAMEPEIRRGTVLFFRKVETREAIPGEIYLVISPEFTGIRYLRRVKGSDEELRLVPRNTTDYDEVVLAPDQIEHLYHVRGIVIEKGG